MEVKNKLSVVISANNVNDLTVLKMSLLNHVLAWLNLKFSLPGSSNKVKNSWSVRKFWYFHHIV